jgi:hypothetical protein
MLGESLVSHRSESEVALVDADAMLDLGRPPGIRAILLVFDLVHPARRSGTVG